jgi:hypothetical protein
MNVMKYLKLVWVANCIGPEMFKCTNSSGTLALVAPSRGNDSLCFFLHYIICKNGKSQF